MIGNVAEALLHSTAHLLLEYFNPSITKQLLLLPKADYLSVVEVKKSSAPATLSTFRETALRISLCASYYMRLKFW